jgi:hypothetical protein
MYIVNPQVLDQSKLFKCNKIIADWLVDNYKLPILSIKGRDFYFSITSELTSSLAKLPFWLVPFLHIPKCFG